MFRLALVVVAWSVLATCAIADAPARHQGFTVAEAGKPRVLLVLADKPENPQVIKYAAEEFQRVIQKATGAQIAAIPEKQLDK